MHIVNRSKGAGGVARLLRRKSSTTQPWQLRWKPVCASTEIELTSWLKQNPIKGSMPRAFLADRQTHATGQQGRHWHSPVGGVWISAAFPISHSPTSPGILGLAVAVSLAQRLERFNVPVQIKWPNDLLVSGRKLAGFLPRLIHRGERITLGRIGLGLNVCNHVPIGAIALQEILEPRKCDYDFWSVEVICALERAVELIDEGDYVCCEAERILWARTIKEPLTGGTFIIEGLNNEGALKLRKGIYKTIWNRWPS